MAAKHAREILVLSSGAMIAVALWLVSGQVSNSTMLTLAGTAVILVLLGTFVARTLRARFLSRGERVALSVVVAGVVVAMLFSIPAVSATGVVVPPVSGAWIAMVAFAVFVAAMARQAVPRNRGSQGQD